MLGIPPGVCPAVDQRGDYRQAANLAKIFFSGDRENAISKKKLSLIYVIMWEHLHPHHQIPYHCGVGGGPPFVVWDLVDAVTAVTKANAQR